MKRDPRVAFFDVTLTDAIESPPWGTEHWWPLGGTKRWTSTPDYWEPVLGPVITRKFARRIVDEVLKRYKGAAYHFLVLFEQADHNSVQLALLKTESGADDLHQLSNCKPPAWWRLPYSSLGPVPKPPKPTTLDRLMGPDLI
jgi:hypothetical protein